MTGTDEHRDPGTGKTWGEFLTEKVAALVPTDEAPAWARPIDPVFRSPEERAALTAEFDPQEETRVALALLGLPEGQGYEEMVAQFGAGAGRLWRVLPIYEPDAMDDIAAILSTANNNRIVLDEARILAGTDPSALHARLAAAGRLPIGVDEHGDLIEGVPDVSPHVLMSGYTDPRLTAALNTDPTTEDGPR